MQIGTAWVDDGQAEQKSEHNRNEISIILLRFTEINKAFIVGMAQEWLRYIFQVCRVN